jgi:hypothetical protein
VQNFLVSTNKYIRKKYGFANYVPNACSIKLGKYTGSYTTTTKSRKKTFPFSAVESKVFETIQKVLFLWIFHVL